MQMNFCDYDAIELRKKLGAGEISALSLLESCIARIESLNPKVNAIVSKCFDRARAEARQADILVRKKNTLPPLHGLPIGIKDLNETMGLRTTFGSKLYENFVPSQDESIVIRLRRAGAIIIGKTNTPEFGAGSNTTNKVFGSTRNPFNLEFTPGGSSGGSAAAVATGMVPLAHGSDTFGSLRNPATWCGIVGFRPTPGLVAREKRKINYTHFSVQGPMARSVMDIMLMMTGLVGYDPRDPMSVMYEVRDFMNCGTQELSNLNVGWSADFSGQAPVDNDIRKRFSKVVKALDGVFSSFMESEFSFSGARDTLWTLRCQYYLVNHKERVEKYPDLLSPNIVRNVNEGLKMSLADAANAEKNWAVVFQDFQRLFEVIDLLILPGNAIPPFLLDDGIPDKINGVPLENYVEASLIRSIVTLSGHPVIAIPCGLDHLGLPFGVQLVGRRHSDKTLLSFAAALQNLFQKENDLKQPKPNIKELSL